MVDLDLSKNRINSAAVVPFTRLFEENFKIRSINLRHNLITDEGAQLLVQSVVNNVYITKLQLEMNPLRHSVIVDIEKHTAQNQLKVS